MGITRGLALTGLCVIYKQGHQQQSQMGPGPSTFSDTIPLSLWLTELGVSAP